MMQASKDSYLLYEEAVKEREVFELNGYLLIAFTSRMMLAFNYCRSSNKLAHPID